MKFGEKLKVLRHDRGLTQPEMAEAIGIEQSYLSKLENDKSLPSEDTFVRILEVFGLDSLKGMPSLRELRELAEQKGVELPGEDDDEGDAPAEPPAPPGEPAGYEVAVASPELEFVDEDLEEENEHEDDDWEPPEIVEPEPER